MSQEQFYLLAAKVLSRESSAEEKAELEQLVNSNAAWKEQFQNLEEIWQSGDFQPAHSLEVEDAYLMHLANLKDAAPDFPEHSAQYQPSSDEDFRLYPVANPWYRRWTSIAAAAATILGLGYGLFQWTKAPQPALAQQPKSNNEITVKKGAKTKLQLPDGSKVWVNSDSKLSYPETFQGNQRDVYLEGEAYFDVVKDPKHPFIVHTSGIDVRVLGTAFNVKSYEAEPTIEATLVHGMIEVTKINEPTAPKVILKHHEKLIYNKFVKTTINETPAENKSPQNSNKPAITIAQIAKQTPDSAFLETAWVYNRLRFEDERMDALALKMERWFDVNIRINNDKLKAYRLTGSFENETIEEALKALQYLVSFKYRIENRNVTITQ